MGRARACDAGRRVATSATFGASLLPVIAHRGRSGSRWGGPQVLRGTAVVAYHLVRLWRAPTPPAVTLRAIPTSKGGGRGSRADEKRSSKASGGEVCSREHGVTLLQRVTNASTPCGSAGLPQGKLPPVPFP